MKTRHNYKGYKERNTSQWTQEVVKTYKKKRKNTCTIQFVT